MNQDCPTYRPHIWMADGDEPVSHIADWKRILKDEWARMAIAQGSVVYWQDESPIPIYAMQGDGNIFEAEVYGTRINHNFK